MFEAKFGDCPVFEDEESGVLYFGDDTGKTYHLGTQKAGDFS